MNKSGERVRSWKGKSQESIEPPKYRWQVEVERQPKSSVPGRLGRRMLVLFLCSALGLLGAFVYLLLYLPTKTPLISVAATNYAWPLPPNAWALEDIRAFASLDAKTVRWKDASHAWQSKQAALESLRFQLQDAAPLAKKSGAVILYLNMHGAVNEQNVPCLLPPQASPLVSNQWIALDEIFALISTEAPPLVEVLLVLDCVDQQLNWHTAMLSNTFVENVEAWVASNADNRVHVLCSSAPDQQAWSGPELGASIFGREFRLGLAGAADRPRSTAGGSGGNGDGAVDLIELVNYVGSEVDQWAQNHRGVSQTPRLFSKRAEDVRLGWALTSRELRRQLREATGAGLAPSSLSAQEQFALWQKMDQLRQLQLYRHDPENWLQLERKVLWLDELSRAGSAYADLAAGRTFPELTQRLQTAIERAIALTESRDFFSPLHVLKPSSPSATPILPLPSLALKELSGEVTATTAADVRRRMLDAAPLAGGESLEQISQSLGLPPDAANWTELNFQQLLVKYGSMSIWPDRSLIRQALELRHRCEQLAVAGDVRGHRWRRVALDAADQHRRAVEDELILGPAAERVVPMEDFRQSLEAIATGPSSVQTQIDSAWALRDRGLAEIGYIAAWMCSPATDMEDLGDWRLADSAAHVPAGLTEAAPLLSDSEPFQREQIAMQELLRLIYSLHDLGDLLARADVQGVEQLAPLEIAATNVQRDLDSLHLLVRDHLGRAVRPTQTSPGSIRAILALLQLPFLPAEDRLALHRKLSTLLQTSPALSQNAGPQSAISSLTLTNQAPAQPATDATGQPIDSSSSPSDLPVEQDQLQAPYSQRLRSWEVHPLSALLLLKENLLNPSYDSRPGAGSMAVDDAPLEAIDTANARLRRHYLSMLTFSDVRLADWLRTAGVDLVIAVDRNDWFSAGVAEHLARSVLPVCPLRLDTYSTTAFRTLSLQDMLLWYASRTMSDFYAEAYPSPLQLIPDETFFEHATRQLLNFVVAVGNGSSETAEIAGHLHDRLAVLGPLARNALQSSLRLGAPSESLGGRPVEISMQSAVAQQPTRTASANDMPPGIATAMIRDPSGSATGPRAAVPMPISADGERVTMIAPLDESEEDQELAVVYRGHELRMPLFVGQGIVVDFEPAGFDWAEVTLRGDRQRQPSIMFVVDCSWSMGGPLPVEAIGSETQSKLELAKQSVLRLVRQLAARPDARLGVRLFGHRVGWSRPVDEQTGEVTGRPQILPQPNYPDPIPADVLPSNDVEAVVPLGRYTTAMVGGLSAKLSGIVPWGQSPLYLAMIEAFRDFAADDASTAKCIVVITDGDNFQFSASNRPGGESGVSTSLADVERAWQTAQIPLFIMGVGISGDDAAQTRTTLEGLAERTGGSYYDVNNGSELLRALLEQLATGVYEISRAATSRVPMPDRVAEAKLNTTIELSDIDPGIPYQIQFQSLAKTFHLQGGESLEMVIQPDGQDIIGVPYEVLAPRAATLVRAGDIQEFVARVHRPSLHGGGVTFPISVQDPTSHFTPRPSQWWIEISPVGDPSTAAHPRYVFYDTHYTPRLPVPAVAWYAPNWPAAATQADVNVWIKYASTPELYSVGMQELQGNGQAYAVPSEVPGLSGVRLQIQMLPASGDSGGLEIQVTETHSEASLGIGSLRVLFENADRGLPVRVIRRFEPANKMAIHTFKFEGLTASEIFNSPHARIVLCSRSAVLDGAWQLEGGRPIRVEIAPSSDALPLEAATFDR